MIERDLFGEGTDATPDLATYDWIVVNSSAGKDSQAMLDRVIELADAAKVRDRVVVLHCDLGLSPKGQPIEWPGTPELAREHAQHYGVRFLICRRGVRGFIEEIEDRGKFPSDPQRYCTSYFKREPGNKVLTQLARETRKSWPNGFLEMIEHRGKFPSDKQRFCTDRGKTQPGNSALVQLANEVRPAKPRPRLLNCLGFRAQESPRRKKLAVFAERRKVSNGAKYVADWLPIHTWTTEQVWARIKAAGTRHHAAYDQGMSRLSCRFCIYAPKGQLILSGKLNPELLQEYVDLEKRIGHSFRKELPLADVQKAIQAGECGQAGDDGCWNM